MRGTLTGQRYVDDILRPHVAPFLNGLPGEIFQKDDARPHTVRVAEVFLRHFQTLPWPARSPDLSLVEHVWHQLKRQMPSCHSVHDLELAVQDLVENVSCARGSFELQKPRPCASISPSALMVSKYNRVTRTTSELYVIPFS
ncbi:DDE_3 domain-containing protein [Trichonephila clavipes]|nr:DDE_3 domain-containing protein [Trichonephila clavipes]